MNGQKHALIFFTKAPVVGLTKTRLTEARGGILTPQEAAEFYQAVMLDTAEVGFKALEELNQMAVTTSGTGGQPDTYDFFVSSIPEKERSRMQQIFDEAGPWPFPIRYISDKGSNFNEHFDDAFKQLWKLGYHSAVSIGGDLPLISVSNIVRAFKWLRYFDETCGGGGLVHCPCQACGVSLVGITRTTPMNFDGVFYNANGIPAMDAIINLSAKSGIPVAAMNTAADIDNTEDLAHAISMARSHAYASQFQPELMVPRRFLDWADRTGIVITTPPNTEHDPREMIDA